MTARLLADAVVAIHFAFIAFVIGGGLLVFKYRWWAAWHLPAVAWAAWTELTGTVCPLTPLENAFRRAAGDAGYAGGFVERYLVPVIYPAGLTAHLQLLLGIAILALNALIYAIAWRTAQRGRRCARASRRENASGKSDMTQHE